MSKDHSIMDLLAIARKRWPWVLGSIVLLVGLGAYYTSSQAPRYEATARVLLSDNASERTLDPSSQNTGFLTREMSNELSVAKGEEVRALVEAELGLEPNVAISPEIDADLLAFRASASRSEQASRYANTWAITYVQVRQQQELAELNETRATLQARLDQLQQQQDEIRRPLDALRRQIRANTDPDVAIRLQQDYDLLNDDLRYELDIIATQAGNAVASLDQLDLQAELIAVDGNRVVQQAEVPDESANTPLARTLVVVGILGAVLGIALAVLVDNRDTTIRTAADVADATGLPVVAALPRAPKAQLPDLPVAILNDPQGVHADEVHKARSSLELMAIDNRINSVMVTSANPSEGTSTIASNLALALSSAGNRTVLVDINYRRSAIHTIYGVPQEPGLSELVRREVEASKIAHEVDGEASQDLLVVPSGKVPASAAAFVAQNGFLKTLAWMGSQAEILVIDAPSMLEAPEAHTLARQSDAVLLTVMAGRTTRGDLAETIAILDQMEAMIVGVVLVGAPDQDGVVVRVGKRIGRDDRGRRRSVVAAPALGSGASLPESAAAQDSTPSVADVGTEHGESDDRSPGDDGPVAIDEIDPEFLEKVTSTSELVAVTERPAPLPPTYPANQGPDGTERVDAVEVDAVASEAAVGDDDDAVAVEVDTGDVVDVEETAAEAAAGADGSAADEATVVGVEGVDAAAANGVAHDGGEDDTEVEPELDVDRAANGVEPQVTGSESEIIESLEAQIKDLSEDRPEPAPGNDFTDYAEVEYDNGVVEYAEVDEYIEDYDEDDGDIEDGELVILDLDGLEEHDDQPAPDDAAALVIVNRDDDVVDDSEVSVATTEIQPEDLAELADTSDADELIAIDLDQLTDEFLQVTEGRIASDESETRAEPQVSDYRS